MGRHTPEAALLRRLDRAESTVASLRNELAKLNDQVDAAVVTIHDHAGTVTDQDKAAAQVAEATKKLADALAEVSGGGPSTDPTQASPVDAPQAAPEPANTPSATWPLQS